MITIQAKQDFLLGVHGSTDTYKLALYTGKATLSEKTDAYSPINEVVGEGYQPGGKNLDGHSVSEDGGFAILSFKTPSWENSSITARAAIIYNSTKSNKVLAVFNFGKDVTSTNGVFAATIPPATKETGLIRFA